MVRIDADLERYIKGKFPKRIVHAYYKKGTWQTSRWIYVTTIQEKNEEIHYEYIGGNMEMHFESDEASKYRMLIKRLKKQCPRDKNFQWRRWGCTIEMPLSNWDQLVDAFKAMMSIFDPLIEKSTMADNVISGIAPYEARPFDESDSSTENVRLRNCTLGEIFSNKLVIPDYQRNYCWERRQIQSLWDTICRISDRKTHLGTIILQRNKIGAYEVIDGQQRLVTLTLICQALCYKGSLSLLGQTFRSETSKRHIGVAKWLIQQLVARTRIDSICRYILDNILFSVLILQDNSLDLAYTFFTNENSKGVPLSDYDLLKAHHLRFIADESQAEHLAKLWNAMTCENSPILKVTLGVHLLRLRKWMRKESADSNRRFYVRDEFSASAIVPEIPPFGERFNFYEKIQGGSHFFAYVAYFVRAFIRFSQTKPVNILRKQFTSVSHWRYGSVIETLLFAYFLKFGEQYLPEALFCIASSIAQHRYLTERALSYKINEYAMSSGIAMMIDQSSSPTFFLAECMASVKTYGADMTEDEIGIKWDFYQKLQDAFDEINIDFTSKTIRERYQDAY